ncbi:hypothetical protein NQ176_g797 [Zarea fungicola]|uniref:Uncharacterized protein n=1 Tax=Zarea fungicola TaxID=93591 RepID=A0ACC1NVE9_9HYPO|nr:hypothetical protein NQ176_g797 [Lecanicillium fungicola]
MAREYESRPLWAPILGIFDFPLAFEEVILQVLPTGLVIALLPFTMYQYWKQPVYVPKSSLLRAKTVASAALIAVEAISLVLRLVLTEFRASTAVPATSLELVAALTIGTIIYLEHRYAIRTSSLLTIYLALGLLIDTTKSRAFFLQTGFAALGALAALSGCLRLVLLILEGKSRRDVQISIGLRDSPEADPSSCFLNRLLFLFLTPMLAAGFSQKLQPDYLTKLGQDFSSHRMHQLLKKHLKSSRREISRGSLMFACLEAWKYQILQILILRLVSSGFSFAQPFLIQRILEAVAPQMQEVQVQEFDHPPLALSTFIIFAGAALSETIAVDLGNRFITQVRGGLITSLFDKTQCLAEHEARKSAVVTLMSTDIEAILSGLSQCIEIPITIAEIFLAIYFLSYFIGYSCIILLFPVLLTIATSYFLGKWIRPAFAEWNKCIDSRVAQTSKILSQLAPIKMFGLGPTISTFIQRLRVEEVEVSKKYRTLVSFSVFPVQFADLMTPIFVVAGGVFWKGFNGGMTASQAFPTLVAVAFVKEPLAAALEADSYAKVISMVTCFRRLEAFFGLEDRQDSRIKWDPSAPPETYGSHPTHFESTIMEPRASTSNPMGTIQFVNALFGPRSMPDPLLTGVSFSLSQSSVTGVVGPTGSGKSTLLSGILGETSNAGGYIYVRDEVIAYCGEQVWLRDVSIRENILNYLPYDKERFIRAIRSCQLEEDLIRLPGGENYVVGTAGVNLSGGQRQRIGIARTVYAEAPVTVLDDVFSSIDRVAAVSIMFNLCGDNGVLREAGSTVLFVTHLSEFARFVDQLLIVDGRGSVILDKGVFRSPDHEQAIAELINSTRVCVLPDVEDKERALICRSLEHDFSAAEDSSNKKGHVRQRGDLRLYLLFIDPSGRLNAFLYSLFVMVLSAGEILPDIYIGFWIETDPNSMSYFLGYASIGVTTCLIGCLVYFLLYTKFAAQASIYLHEQLVNVTVGSTLAFLSVTKAGHLLNLFSQDCLSYSRNVPGYMMRTLYVFVTAVIVVAIILSRVTYMSVTLPAIIISLLLTQHFYLRTSREMRHLDIDRKAVLSTFFKESADGLVYIQSSQSQQKNLELGYRLLNESQLPFYLMNSIQRWLKLVLGLTNSFLALTLVIITVHLKKSTTQSAVGLSFIAIFAFDRTIIFLLESWTQLETSTGALSRLRQFKQETPQENRLSLVDVPDNWPSAGKIDISNVTARYRPSKDIPPILKNISLSINPGEKIGLVGRTGSGKTSILLMLLGFLEYSGTVEIDDIDIAKLSVDVLRSRLITISQEQIKLDATIRTNLLPFSMNDNIEKPNGEAIRHAFAQDKTLKELLQRLNIWSQIQDRGGLDAMLNEVGYSKGELQLLCIARAIVRRREIGTAVVLVDEATSSTDAASDELAQRAMREAFADCTVLIVAHREEILNHVDCTIELAKGEVTHIDFPNAAPGSSFDP